LQPDVLLLDLQMPGATASATVRHVQRYCPTTRIVILTAYDDAVYVRGMVTLAVAGYMLKDEAPEMIIVAIRSVMQSGRWFSDRVREMLAKQEFLRETSAAALYPARRRRDASPIPLTTTLLTRQQRTILRLVEHALTNDEIAEHLCISPKTVKRHLEDIFKRLNVHARETAARVARGHGYLD